ncbi:MAG TPA: serine acetyltransferase, partial [Polyangiaceae bacterium]|nr:serine acetyltransferase [Polyangiaceae bacterium]
FLPSKDEIIAIVRLFFELLYPGYFGRQDLTDEMLAYHVGALVSTLRDKLAKQIELCLCHAAECGDIVASCSDEALRLANLMLSRVPALRRVLISDAQAAMDGDPAASGLHEIILSYPGFQAVTIFRIAHELHTMGVPLLPRIMTEWAHAQTGADIHPGANIGPSFFIDHATGVVIGETSRIGEFVKLYQGVTLGALSHPKDEQGRVIRGTKRHPTVEDGVTVYANATVLGGATTLGSASVVGGSVFLTKSVPPGSRVAMKSPELNVRTTEPPPADEPITWEIDYEI